MTDIAAAIDAYNTERLGLLKTRNSARGKQNVIMAALAFLVFGLASWRFRSGGIGSGVAILFIGIIVLAIGFFVMRGLADNPGIALQETVREQIFPALFADVEGLRFQADTKGFYDEVPDGIKPGGDRRGWGDLIEGTFKGQSLAINEVSISQTTERDGKKTTFQVFQGVAIRFGLTQSAPELLVTKNKMAVAKWVSGALGTGPETPHIVFGEEAFENVVDVHSSNEAFARAVFSEQGRAQYLSMRGTLARGGVSLAAAGNVAFLLIEHELDFFELPPLDRPFSLDTDGARLQDEMRGFLELVDAMRVQLDTAAASQFRL